MAKNTVGPKGQLYANPTQLPGETSFQKDNNSSTYYNSPYFLAHQKQVQPIPPARNTTPLELHGIPAPRRDGCDHARRKNRLPCRWAIPARPR